MSVSDKHNNTFEHLCLFEGFMLKLVQATLGSYAGQSSQFASNINFLSNYPFLAVPGVAPKERRLAAPEKRIQER